MQFLLNFIFSTRFTTILLFAFAYMVGAATFLEDQYDTTTAQIVIFRSKWLELILGLLVINFLGNIQKYKMISQKKWPSLMFHLAFVLIIVGAGVTRYFGYEGMMLIREGTTSNIMHSAEPYLTVEVSKPPLTKEEKRHTIEYSKAMLMAATTDNEFDFPSFDFQNQKVEVSYVDYIKNADYKLYENIRGGKDVLEVVTTKGEGREFVYIESGESERVGNVLVSFNDPSIRGAISVFQKGDEFIINSPFQINRMVMADQTRDTVQPNTDAPMKFRQLHQVQTQGGFETSIVFGKKLENAVKNLETIEGESKRGDALKVQVKVGEQITEVVLFGGPNRIPSPEYFSFMGYEIKASYGSKPIELPFSLRLDDFILERYPGSDNPSGYKSEVTLYDEKNAVTKQHSIFMNNVLDYEGYRFFQSSFDKDEKGTKLSVNHDAPGTYITYIGYLFLGLGFVLSLFNKNSRFNFIMKKVKELRKKRISLGILFLFLSFASVAHNEHNHSHESQGIAPLGGSFSNGARRITKEHADRFGKLIVQSADGRFEPINTLALDIIHKISKKDNIQLDSIGTFTPEQFLLELIVNGKLFESQRIIYVSSDSLRKFLGVKEGKYVSYLDFFDLKGNGDSKIKKYAIEAGQKDAAKRDRWDKEIIKVGDKLETFFRTQEGDLLRIFPSNDSTLNNKWVSPRDESAAKTLSGTVEVNGKEISLNNTSYKIMYASYIVMLHKGEFDKASMILDRIEAIQKKFTPEDFLPSQSKIDLEINYNNSSIFSNIKKAYGMLSVFLLIFGLVEVMASVKLKFKKIVSFLLKIAIGIFALFFLYHTYGLILRWYLTSHAPWSNGYEALIFIAWGTCLAGLIFARYSKLTTAGTAFVAFLIIMTAGHENMDPQLTNLVPVLKSYWLVIHVACITTSYGFFALGAILGLIVLGVMLFKNIRNFKKINLLTSELTFINEMTVTIGVVLAAIGTFLGGVWANESWGRYWGWDAKETWALVIVIVYAMLLHFRFVPGFIRGKFFFNAFGTIVGFGAVCMTFFGVNYYFSKSIHSYAAGDPPAFPIWLWITIGSIFALTILAGLNESRVDKLVNENKQ
ncbi:MAG: hypothetical protein CMP67_01660 [Flavobacteriales bacterium]|nr:hypothetical protein [Flavobacteriales bacterium]